MKTNRTYFLKFLSFLIIFIWILNFSFPIFASQDTKDSNNQDESTNIPEVSLDAKVCSIDDSKNIGDGTYQNSLKIENGGILKIIAKVNANSGYLKNLKISLDNPNFVLGKNFDISVNKITSTKEQKNSDYNTIVNEAATNLNTTSKALYTSGTQTISESTAESIWQTASNDLAFESIADGVPSSENIVENNVVEENTSTATEQNDEIKCEIKDNSIEINEINSNREVNILIPISFDKSQNFDQSYFARDTKISFAGEYINSIDKNKTLEKSEVINVSWSTSSSIDLKQEIIRYLKYEENKSLLTMRISDKVIDDKVPFMDKNYEINVPNLNGILPNSVIISARNTKYSLDGEKLLLSKRNDGKSNNLVTKTSDIITVTYLFENDNIPEDVDFSSDIKVNMNLADNENITQALENTKYSLKGETGRIVDMTLSAPTEISKGFMYSNLDKANENKFDTDFFEIVNIDVGFKDLIDKVEFTQDNTDNNLKTKKVEIDIEYLLDVLGTDGYIDIYDNENNKLGTINSKNTSCEINTDKSIRLETSKPEAEGNLPVLITRSINANVPFTREQIKSIIKITDNLTVKGILQDKEIASGTIKLDINTTDPTSKADVDISRDSISTIDENNDIDIIATLETNSINDYLFKNPTLKFELPTAVKNINVKDAKLIYDNELTPVNYSANGNTIDVKLEGTQTQYSTQAVSKGTMVKLTCDLEMDNLAISNSEGKVKLTYSNQNSGEVNSTETNINVVAPEGFVLTNKMKIADSNGENVKEFLAQETKNQEYKFKGFYGKDQTADIICDIVNNVGADVQNVKILGRTFSSGVSKTDQSEEDLSANFDTKLKGAISGTNVSDYVIYYSDNGSATADLNDANNAWKNEFDENAKSYLIVKNSDMKVGEKFTFKYTSSIPRDVDYDKQATEMYSIYYTNQNDKVKNSATCKMYTNSKPVIDVQMTAKNFYTGEEIFQGDNTYFGDIIEYKVKVKNNSVGDISNLNCEISMDDFYQSRFATDSFISGDENSTKFTLDHTKEVNIDNIQKDQTYELTFYMFTANGISDGSENYVRTKVTSEDMDEPSECSFKTIGATQKMQINLEKDDTSKTSYNEGDEIGLNLNIINSKGTFKDGNITLQLPDNLEFASGDNITYSKKKKLLEFDTKDLKDDKNSYFTFTLKPVNVNEEKEESLVVNANYKYDENNQTNEASASSRALKLDIGSNKNVEVSFTSNKGDALTDNENLIYYLQVKNNSSQALNISVTDVLPDSLYLEKVVRELETTYGDEKNNNSSTIGFSSKVEPTQTMKVTIYAKPKAAEDGYTVENKPTITVGDQEISVNSITNKVLNSVSKSQDSNSSVFSIVGTAWEDNNNDGIRQSDEKLLSNIVVQLMDKNTNSVVTDSNGTPITALTDENGRYELNNIRKGNYYVIARYDSNQYKITQYQSTGKDSFQVNDFTQTVLNGTKVAATDLINLDSVNNYDVDLGLGKKDKFDLSLDMGINKVTVTNPNKATESKDYDFKKILKRDFSENSMNTDSIMVEYKIRVKNEGTVAGFCKEIKDIIPDGMSINSELNPEWVTRDDIAYNDSLANTIINPSETKEVSLILSKKMSGDSVGLMHNVSQISKTYNEKALADSNSDNNNSNADIFLSVETGIKKTLNFMKYVVIALLSLAVIIYVSKTIYTNKNKKINKWKK